MPYDIEDHMPATLTLTDFLLARLAEDEAEARRLLRYAQEHELAVGEPQMLGRRIPGWHEWPDVQAMCARVLAEVEAKRRIVERHAQSDLMDHAEFDCTCGFPDHRKSVCLGCGRALRHEGYPAQGSPCLDLRDLAQPYADHPDFRDEWRITPAPVAS